MQELASVIKVAVQKLFNTEVEPVLSRPEEKFGDYATNVALQLAKQAAKSPQEIARALADELQVAEGIKEVTIAGPGFINFRLKDEALANAAWTATNLPQPNIGQEILVEFGDPNPFKEMHIGHLYSYIVGDAISNLLEASGATVKRLSYHGDVGLHVAKAIYGLRQLGQNSSDDSAIEREDFLGKAYAYGAKAYDSDEAAKAEIDQVNQHVYAADDPAINQLHRQGNQLSFEYFDKILNLLSISTDKRYLESQSTEKGLAVVKQNTDKVFEKSEGAVVYRGEKVGLHTRVFITSKDLPTYETKDLGLAELKAQDFPDASRSIIITASEQSEYFKVMLAALNEIDQPTAAKTTHLSHGFVNLSTGKMSSRTGDVYAAMELLLKVKDAVHQQYPDSPAKKDVTFAAAKYALLRHRVGADISYDVKESISLEGNSGPYLQYAHARACSILAKTKTSAEHSSALIDLDDSERSLARKISEYPDVVQKAVAELMPHHICTYLYELAQAFNSFYEKSRIIGDERQGLRLKLVKTYQQVLQSGLELLNIAAPEKM
jgi:arginyl-tRNA synthetase